MRVVVTGLGAITALGIGVDTFWRRLLAGDSGLRPIQRFDTTGLRNNLGGEVPESHGLIECGDRPRAYARAAVDEACRQAGLTERSAAGLVLATNFGGQRAWQSERDEAERFARLDFHRPARDLGFGGPTLTLSNACSSGTNAVGHAADLIRAGLCDIAVAGGFDELGLFCLSGLSILHTITTDIIRPFDANRSGTIFGEGAGALVLESLDHATSRGAAPLAEVLGSGVNNNGYHMTAPDQGGEGMVQAIRLALAQAQLEPATIGHVNAHATGTEYHDPAETAALKVVMGRYAYQAPVSAIKAATGHSMGAAGAIEAIACVLALRDQTLPPTLNLTRPDPACDLDCVTTARRHPFDVALSVSAGLGGNNAALLLGAAP